MVCMRLQTMLCDLGCDRLKVLSSMTTYGHGVPLPNVHKCKGHAQVLNLALVPSDERKPATRSCFSGETVTADLNSWDRRCDDTILHIGAFYRDTLGT